MTLLACWLLFPAVLCALAAGCGLLVERAAGTRLHGALLLPTGLAAIVVAAQFTTLSDATAELTAPVVVGLAVAGLALAWPWGRTRVDGWAVAAAAVVYLVFGAPVLLSGEATFAGYIKLDDTATFLALADHVLEHARNLEGLAPSSHEATLAVNIRGYPLGSLLPLAVGGELVGRDLAWVWQPYLSLLAALLALCLYALVAELIPSRPLRALVAVVAAQPALLFGFALWGGVKELAAAAFLALACALAPLAWTGARASLLPATGVAALLAVLGLPAAVWVLPLAVAAVVLGRSSLIRPAVAAAFVAVLSVPALLASARFLTDVNVDSLRSETELGNLVEALSPLQLLGIWPTGDFRLEPDDARATWVLLAVCAAASVLGVAWAFRSRAWSLLAYVAGALAGAAVVLAVGSPWTASKALAFGSPALLLAAAVGCAFLLQRGRRVEGTLALVAIAGGVLWSNVLAYREVSLAPREQLAELEEIGERFAGQGPALMTEYQPYGVRHFLRRLDAEGVSELRRRPVPRVDGSLVDKGLAADLDELALGGVLTYPTLVLRRSPVKSRPPSGYALRRQGRWYEVWQRPAAAASIVRHLPLGDAVVPVATPPCGSVELLAADGSRVAAVVRPSPVVVALPPSGAATTVELSRRGRYSVWIGGSTRGRATAIVDGRVIGSAGPHLNNTGEYVELGSAVLDAGPHSVAVRIDGGGLRPGSRGAELAGPLVVAPTAARRAVSVVASGEARSLCGRALDWIEELG